MSLRIGGSGEARVTYELSPDLAKTLGNLALATGSDPSTVLRKALALYQVALDAVREGKAVGIAENADQLETEIVGLGVPEHAESKD